MSDDLMPRIIAQEEKYSKFPADRNGNKFVPDTSKTIEERVKAMEDFNPDYRTNQMRIEDHEKFGWPLHLVDE